ncbi:MAG: 4Fe-4S dicluster domain-containing protein [Thermodesulfobacteriota bacterium]
MDRMILLVDIDRCIRCHACEAACKQENNLPAGPRPVSVATVGPRSIDGELHQDFVFAACLHCDDPACMAVCTVGAISKGEDGLVVMDEAKCKSCCLCEAACPFGAMHLRPDTKKAWKCNHCTDRVADGLPPSCVQHCAGGALQYVTPEELSGIRVGRHVVDLGKVCYVSEKWRLASPLSKQF